MPQPDTQLVRQGVRASAPWAGIAAVLLLYFGYNTVFLGSDNAPAQLGMSILAYTLRIGGWALALAAIWLATGMRPALAYDALITALVGAGFLVGGALWTVTGAGLFSLLYVLFGFIFLGSARNSWREYIRFRTEPAGRPPAASPEPWRAPPDEYQPPPGPTESLPSLLRERTRQPAEPEQAAAVSVQTGADASHPAEVPVPPPEPAPPEPGGAGLGEDEAAPDGFLAQFAAENKKPDTTP